MNIIWFVYFWFRARYYRLLPKSGPSIIFFFFSVRPEAGAPGRWLASGHERPSASCAFMKLLDVFSKPCCCNHVFLTSQAFKRASCKRLRLARGSVAKEQGSAMQRFKSVRTFCKLGRVRLQTKAKCSRTSGHLIPNVKQNNQQFPIVGGRHKSLSPPRSPWPPVKSRLILTEAFCRDVNLFKGVLTLPSFHLHPGRDPG